MDVHAICPNRVLFIEEAMISEDIFLGTRVVDVRDLHPSNISGLLDREISQE
jgi:hypothetical protein